MTDDPDDLMDELLSADLDGETTQEEHDRVEADPSLRARRASLRQASELTAQPPPPLGPTAVDAAVNRAVAAYRPAITTRPRRRTALRRPRSQPRAVAWLVAAAVVLLAGTGLALIVTDTSPSRRPEAATATTAARSQSKSATPGASENATAGAVLAFIGNFSSPATLRASSATRLPRASADTSTSRVPQLFMGQADRCSTVLEARDPRLVRSNRRSVVAASIDGQPVVVLEYRARKIGSTRQTTRVIAVGAVACNERVDFQR